MWTHLQSTNNNWLCGLVPNSPFDGSKIWVIKRACKAVFGVVVDACMSLQFGFVGLEVLILIGVSILNIEIFLSFMQFLLLVYGCTCVFFLQLGYTRMMMEWVHSSTSLALQNLKIWNSLSQWTGCSRYVFCIGNLTRATLMFCTILVLNSIEETRYHILHFLLGRGKKFFSHVESIPLFKKKRTHHVCFAIDAFEYNLKF